MNYPTVPEGFEWVGVDLDRTIARSIWPEVGIGEPIPEGVEAARHYHSEGYRIIIYTSRSWFDHGRIQAWLEHHGVKFDQIVCGKVAVGLLIDDRAWHPPWAE